LNDRRPFDIPLAGGDGAGADGLLDQPRFLTDDVDLGRSRIADDVHRLTDGDGVRIAQLGGGQVASLNFKDRYVLTGLLLDVDISNGLNVFARFTADGRTVFLDFGRKDLGVG